MLDRARADPRERFPEPRWTERGVSLMRARGGEGAGPGAARTE